MWAGRWASRLDGAELDAVLRGMRACVLGEEPDVPLSEYVPKAAAILQAKRRGRRGRRRAPRRLPAAAAEDGATQTASGLVVKTSRARATAVGRAR